jgi:hypothetical protein
MLPLIDPSRISTVPLDEKVAPDTLATLNQSVPSVIVVPVPEVLSTTNLKTALPDEVKVLSGGELL